MVSYLTRYCNYHGTYGNVFMEISIGTGQETETMAQENSTHDWIVTVMLCFSSLLILLRCVNTMLELQPSSLN